MRVMIAPVILVIAACLTGCGSQPASAPAEGPLTLEQWKALPPEAKYEIDTLERLKQGNPKLQDQREWDRFTRDVLLPAKKKDQPNGKSR